MAEPEVLTAAVAYLQRGWSVIPIQPKSKLPAIPWEEYQQRLAGEAELAEWLRLWPLMNIGIVTGTISRLVVLDLDPRHGGLASLRELEGIHGGLPPTVAVETGGGGRHLYFALPPVPVRNKAGLAAGIDLRGEGGMVVAPPSTHPSGKLYRWLPGHDPAALPLAGLPGWLLQRALGSPAGRGHPLAYWRALVRTGVTEGVRNNTVASLAGHLFWHGVDSEVATELLLCWNRVRCRPPLDDAEVARVVSSIARLHAGREE